MEGMVSGPKEDLNQVITSAVQARIEAEVLAVLSGDDVFGAFITAALRQPVEKERYSREQVTWLSKVVEEALKDAARQAVHKAMEDMAPQIQAEVEKAIRRDIKGIAGSLVGSITQAVSAPYGVTVTLKDRSE